MPYRPFVTAGRTHPDPKRLTITPWNAPAGRLRTRCLAEGVDGKGLNRPRACRAKGDEPKPRTLPAAAWETR
jgi:hypothetical protein